MTKTRSQIAADNQRAMSGQSAPQPVHQIAKPPKSAPAKNPLTKKDGAAANGKATGVSKN